MEDHSERVRKATMSYYPVDGYDDEFTISGTRHVIPDVPSAAPGVLLRPAPILSGAATDADKLHESCSRSLVSPSSSTVPSFTTTESRCHTTSGATKPHPSKIAATSHGTHSYTNNGTKKQHLQAASIVKTSESVRVEQPVVVPELASEDHKLVLATTTSVAAFDQNSLAMPTTKKKITANDAREAVGAIVMFMSQMAEGGVPCDVQDAVQWVLRQQQANKNEHVSIEQERRGYHWDGLQRNEDRAIEERRHCEKLAAAREDNEWLAKLRSELDKTVKALANAVVTCFAIFLAIRLFVPLLQAFQEWQQTTYQELMCGRNQAEEPLFMNNNKSYWFYPSFLDSFTFLDSFRSYQERVLKCLQFSASHYSCYIIALGTILVGPWVLERVVPLPFSKRAATPALLICYFYYEGWIPTFHVMPLGLCLGVAWFLAFLGLKYQYKSFARSFIKSGGTPSVAQVNESAEWFDTATTILQVVPVLGGMVWLPMSMIFGAS